MHFDLYRIEKLCLRREKGAWNVNGCVLLHPITCVFPASSLDLDENDAIEEKTANSSFVLNGRQTACQSFPLTPMRGVFLYPTRVTTHQRDGHTTMTSCMRYY